jgi:SAM-dependent methyltransferase
MTTNHTVNFLDLVNRAPAPIPWSEGETIPWNEPGFSQRMLAEHLTQDHDHASRTTPKIERHIDWIHQTLLGGRSAVILDMGCGPGLYGQRLVKLGHTYRGIDFSPASIDYARQTAARENLTCTYLLSDLRQADFGPDESVDLVMQIAGEMNVFRPDDFRLILAKARAALKPGGQILIEVSVEEYLRQRPTGTSWYASPGGFWCATPHVVLEETFWDEATQTTTRRFFVIDAQTGEITRCAQSLQAYSDDQYRAVLTECGFTNITVYPALAAAPGDPRDPYQIAITATRP